MAQLRDAQTSELIAEGDALDLVVIADELGFDEVLFDDVGEHFDPAAALEERRGRAPALDEVAASASVDDDGRARAADAAKRERDFLAELVGGRTEAAASALETARERATDVEVADERARAELDAARARRG
jgi:hypothetical protein